MMTKDKYQDLAAEAKGLKATNAQGVIELIIQVSWIAVGYYLSTLNTTWILGQFLLGVGFWRAFAILHACGHNSFLKNRKLNDLAGLMMSPLCFIPYHPWKYIHQDHHVWTGWKDIDPTTRGLMKEPGRWQQAVLNFCWKSWIPLISIHYIVTVFFDLTHTSLRNHNRKLFLAAMSTFWVVAFHGTLIYSLGTQWLMIFGLSSFIYLNLGDISLLTQHVHLPLDQANGIAVNPKANWEQDEYSHTMVLPDFVTKWIVLGFNHHSLHHLFPNLPYYKSHLVEFKGQHTHGWKEWILKTKSMKATELIFHAESEANNAEVGFSEGIESIGLDSKVIVVNNDNRTVL